jgi:hypothetical protein
VSWIKTLVTLHGFYGKYKKLDKLSDYAKKIKKINPVDASPKDLSYFRNPALQKSIKHAEMVLAAAQDAERETLEYPRVGIDGAIDKYGHYYERKGPDSPEYKKARNALLQVFFKHSAGLVKMQGELTNHAGDLADSVKLAKAQAEYCGLLEKAFEKFARIPNIGGTGGNAAMLSLSLTLSSMKGIQNDIVKTYQRLEKKNGGFQKEVTDSQKIASKMQKDLKAEQNNDPSHIKAQTKALEALVRSLN